MRAVLALVAFAEPLVLACRGLARVNVVTLWDEVADGLAFTNPRELLTPVDELNEDQRAWRERFPPAAEGEKRYCSTCRFRPAPDCDERQLFWLERHAARRRAIG